MREREGKCLPVEGARSTEQRRAANEVAVMKIRLDKLLVDRALAPTRERAQALILAGRVLVNEQKIEKPGHAVADESSIRILGSDLRYVSRGGLKLEAALRHWQIDVAGRFCCDIGASTGGFTDCMLQHGAARVLAVDTGYGQIAQNLRDDARVTLMERTNARLLNPGNLPPGITFFSVDVSFISATLVVPPVLASLRVEGEGPSDIVRHASDAVGHSALEAVILVKPQFEAGREHIGKGGIVRDPAAHQLAIDRVRGCVEELGGQSIEVIDSPITGSEGNREFLLHALWPR